MSKQFTFQPDFAFPPGATLLETIEALGLTQKELATRMGRPDKTVNEIIRGTARIMPETALQLEKVTGVPASFWNRAEANYRERIARLEDDERQREEVDWVEHFSYKEMTKLGILPFLANKVERVGQLLRFFGVATPRQWEVTYGELCGAARESAAFKSDLGDLSAWLRSGELLAQKSSCAPYDKEIFETNLRNIRALTVEHPQDVWPEVMELCAAAGVVVVFVPELRNTHVSGFTRWLTPEKAIIQLSMRYKKDDSLWFTFFHEAAHILLHGKRDVFVEYRGVNNPKEKEADQWATDFLIKRVDWQNFIQKLPKRVTASHVRVFAEAQGIAPGIVVGRLQHQEKRIPASYLNELKRSVGIEWEGLS